MASCKLTRASSNVGACVFAPGNSSTNPIYPSGTFWKTAVSLIFIKLPCGSGQIDPTIGGTRPLPHDVLHDLVETLDIAQHPYRGEQAMTRRRAFRTFQPGQVFGA